MLSLRIREFVIQIGYLLGGLFWALVLRNYPAVVLAVGAACALKGVSNAIRAPGKADVWPGTVLVFGLAVSWIYREMN